MLTGFGAQLNASALNIRRVTIERILLELYYGTSSCIKTETKIMMHLCFPFKINEPLIVRIDKQRLIFEKESR